MDKIDVDDLGPFELGVPSDVWFAWGVLTLAMLVYWWVRCRGKCLLTFDVFFVGLYLYLPIVFMSLFAFSPWNIPATGDWYDRYLLRLHEAFYVSLLGAVAFLLAAAFSSRWTSAPPGYRLVYRSLRDFWTTTPGLTLLTTLILALGAVTVATTGVTGSREVVMAHTELRPVAHLFSCFAVLGMYASLIAAYCWRSWKLAALGVLLTLTMLGFGTRKVTVGTLIYFGAVQLINARPRRPLLAGCCAVAAVLGLIAIALGVETVRQEEWTLSRFTAAPAYVLFGNNLSELRDFAWMLAAWDREPLLGTTYTAGLLAWIPAFLLPARKEMSWGAFSTTMTALNTPTGHPGLRPTVFAEAYFNFGVVGAVVFGLLLGAVFGRAAGFAQRTMQLSDPRERCFRLLCVFLFFEFFLRFQQSANYFQSFIELGLLVLGLTGATVLARFRGRYGVLAARIALPMAQQA